MSPRPCPPALLIAVAACNPAGSSSSGAAATTAVASIPAPPVPAPSASASAAPQPWSCFSWAHLKDFSTDCYRTAALCEEGRNGMIRGARQPAPCAPQEHASCTVLRPDASADERCFGDRLACARYRAMVGSRGIDTSPCEER